MEEIQIQKNLKFVFFVFIWVTKMTVCLFCGEREEKIGDNFSLLALSATK